MSSAAPLLRRDVPACFRHYEAHEIEFTVPPDVETELNAFRENTKAVYGEIANPALTVLDIELVPQAHEHGVPLIVDNTSQRRLTAAHRVGRDIIVHSTSKYMDGHATVIGGAIVDGSNSTGTGTPTNTRPDVARRGYHGVVYTKVRPGRVY